MLEKFRRMVVSRMESSRELLDEPAVRGLQDKLTQERVTLNAM